MTNSIRDNLLFASTNLANNEQRFKNGAEAAAQYGVTVDSLDEARQNVKKLSADLAAYEAGLNDIGLLIDSYTEHNLEADAAYDNPPEGNREERMNKAIYGSNLILVIKDSIINHITDLKKQDAALSRDAGPSKSSCVMERVKGRYTEPGTFTKSYCEGETGLPDMFTLKSYNRKSKRIDATLYEKEWEAFAEQSKYWVVCLLNS